jgi:hypothetical protein
MSSGSRMAYCFGIFAALLWVACTKSHDLAGPGLGDGDASIDEGEAGRGGRAGSNTAGRGGSSARGGTGGSGGRAAAGSGGSAPMCGNCPAPGFIAGLATATSCCTSSGACGLTAPTLGVTACQQLDSPGEPDEDCPGAVILGILPLEGCCTPDGVCGAIDDLLGLGCTIVPATNGAAPPRCTP